jgi:hypothetical protein
MYVCTANASLPSSLPWTPDNGARKSTPSSEAPRHPVVGTLPYLGLGFRTPHARHTKEKSRTFPAPQAVPRRAV